QTPPAAVAAAPAATVAASRPGPAMIAEPPPMSRSGFGWPLEGKVVQGYGTIAKGQRNDGINIKAARGTPIKAAQDGVVAYAGNELRGFGNLLLIKHADGWMTAYGHADELLVGRGDMVKRGQAVAKVGGSGNVGEPQLHFEIRKGVQAVDPTSHLPQRQADAR
ncbi:MAG: M23 family metallopeptidase, partial [Alphaproteobacteria bacterium]|nr:M23 family metallopeptidase [Alphaproteobacteria bacterium]